MTAPKVTEIVRNGNPIGKRLVKTRSAPPISVAQNPSH
jgi:hypothetical protein